MLDSLLSSEGFWGLTGVLLGFALAELSSLARSGLRIRRLKRALKDELRAVDSQINQKLDIISKATEALGQKNILPTTAVRVVTSAFDSHFPELYGHLSLHQRNCLHVAYERLRVADKELERFEDDIQQKITQNVLPDPFEYWRNRMQELADSYGVVRDLIRSYLKGKPIDVFYLG